MNIFWFRQDLRINDNPGLITASQTGTVLPIYILDDDNAAEFKMGAASRWWLHHSLNRLNEALDGKLNVYVGKAETILKQIIKNHSVKSVFWNRCYEPWRILRDQAIKTDLTEAGIACKSFNGSLLWEPFEISKSDGTWYKVFTPYYRRGCLSANPPRSPIPAPKNITFVRDDNAQQIDDLKLLPHIPWFNQMDAQWKIGEPAARERLTDFLENGIYGYKEKRNYPDQKNVSRLSPHLHFGEISPNQVWHAAKAMEAIDGIEGDVDHFLSELGWREFSYYLLYHFPNLPQQNFNPKFDHFPWESNQPLLAAWQKGQTGYPIVDAGMRELWQTGYMHNRVRMIVGSFLVKNLQIHWHQGEKWFWDCLVDADLASNSASWQWVAGSGADAAPYFRIFNPILQGEKFDPLGNYVRKFVPELAKLPTKYLFAPWKAPQDVLRASGLSLGITYPKPIVEMEESRNNALKAFEKLKELTV